MVLTILKTEQFKMIISQIVAISNGCDHNGDRLSKNDTMIRYQTE